MKSTFFFSLHTRGTLLLWFFPFIFASLCGISYDFERLLKAFISFDWRKRNYHSNPFECIKWSRYIDYTSVMVIYNKYMCLCMVYKSIELVFALSFDLKKKMIFFWNKFHRFLTDFSFPFIISGAAFTRTYQIHNSRHTRADKRRI